MTKRIKYYGKDFIVPVWAKYITTERAAYTINDVYVFVWDTCPRFVEGTTWMRDSSYSVFDTRKQCPFVGKFHRSVNYSKSLREI